MLDGWLGQQQKKNRKHHSQIVHLLPLDDFALVMSFFLDFNFVSEQKKMKTADYSDPTSPLLI